jgi:hypothetical protein
LNHELIVTKTLGERPAALDPKIRRRLKRQRKAEAASGCTVALWRASAEWLCVCGRWKVQAQCVSFSCAKSVYLKCPTCFRSTDCTVFALLPRADGTTESCATAPLPVRWRAFVVRLVLLPTRTLATEAESRRLINECSILKKITWFRKDTIIKAMLGESDCSRCFYSLNSVRFSESSAPSRRP